MSKVKRSSRKLAKQANGGAVNSKRSKRRQKRKARFRASHTNSPEILIPRARSGVVAELLKQQSEPVEVAIVCSGKSKLRSRFGWLSVPAGIGTAFVLVVLVT